MAAKPCQSCLRLHRQQLLTCSKPGTIDLVPQQRVPDMRHVHADLMRAPGLEPQLDKRRQPVTGGRVEALRHFVMRYGMPDRARRGPPGSNRRYFGAVGARPRQINGDAPDARLRHTPGDREIGAPQPAVQPVRGKLL